MKTMDFSSITFTVLLCLLQMSSNYAGTEGQFKKLGSHRQGRGVTVIGKFSNPSVFYAHFVKASKPLWMKSALQSVNHPGLTEWTDEFLRKKYGDLTVEVELSKKEEEPKRLRSVSLKEFLNVYNTDDVYMVQAINGTAKIKDLILVPQCLHCGGFQRSITEGVLWLGSGETKSVLHYDSPDNLLCLMDGHKDIILIDKTFRDSVEADGFVSSGGYSLVDVDEVDFKRFPRLQDIEFYHVKLLKGDCIFIPRRWYHQVNSGGKRHMAINIWFDHLHWFDSSNCSTNQDYYKPLEPISKFGFASPNELFRSTLLDQLDTNQLFTKHYFVSTLEGSTEERRAQFFDAIDKYKDSVLSWSEVYGFNIDKAILNFPDIFKLPGNPVEVNAEENILYDPITSTLNFIAETGDDNIIEPIIVDGDVMADDSGRAYQPLPDDPMFDSSTTQNDDTPVNMVQKSDGGEINEKIPKSSSGLNDNENQGKQRLKPKTEL
ncbi:unnamed protein product [Lymnaea stagnalis]|uniref:JmjC domain-containing protein n=1 Tax=Lymnaea stagnalis TaxID=6523 RepID=A0AAV2GY07_LYMST